MNYTRTLLYFFMSITILNCSPKASEVKNVSFSTFGQNEVLQTYSNPFLKFDHELISLDDGCAIYLKFDSIYFVDLESHNLMLNKWVNDLNSLCDCKSILFESSFYGFEEKVIKVFDRHEIELLKSGFKTDSIYNLVCSEYIEFMGQDDDIIFLNVCVSQIKEAVTYPFSGDFLSSLYYYSTASDLESETRSKNLMKALYKSAQIFEEDQKLLKFLESLWNIKYPNEEIL